MKFNKWTLGLAAVGVVSLTSAVRADESKMSQVQTALSNTTISGYVDVSAQYNIGNQNTYNANGVGLGAPVYSYGGLGKADGFNLNSVDLAIDRPQDESSWAAGYHVEIQLGPDNPTGTAIRQAYITLRTPVGNGIDWKVGVFDTIIGYESTTDGSNPNHTRSYGYTIEPTTHTGVLATYKAFDWLTVQLGVANSSNVGGGAAINGRAVYESQKTFMGAIGLTAPESWGWAKGGALNFGIIHSLDGSPYAFATASGNPNTGLGTRDNLYAGITIPTPWDKLKIGASFDALIWGNSTAVVNPSDDYSYAAAVYATVQATDKLSFSARGEYFIDGASDLALYSGGVFPSYAPQVTVEAITLTAQYNLWANVLSRVEFRWDHVESGTPFGANAGVTGDPNHGDSFILAANLIYQF